MLATGTGEDGAVIPILQWEASVLRAGWGENLCCSFWHYSQGPKSMCICQGMMDKESMVFSLKKEGDPAICDFMDEPGGH